MQCTVSPSSGSLPDDPLGKAQCSGREATAHYYSSHCSTDQQYHHQETLGHTPDNTMDNMITRLSSSWISGFLRKRKLGYCEYWDIPTTKKKT